MSDAPRAAPFARETAGRDNPPMATRERMPSADAAWLRMDRPTNLMVINSVLLFDERIDWPRVKEVVHERLVERYPRFRQRAVESGGLRGGAFWEDDPHFDLELHMHHIALPAPGDRAALQELVGDLMAEPLDRSKPLWHFYLIDGYGEGCALYARMHHCIADGIALARVLLSLTDSDPDAGIAPPEPAAGPGPRRLRSAVTRPAAGALHAGRAAAGALAHEGLEMLVHPAAELSRLAALTRTDSKALAHVLLTPADAKTALKGELGVARRVAWSDPFPLDQVRDVAHANSATINDVLVAAMTGALRQYLRQRKSLVDEIRAFVPFNLRPLDRPLPASLGNKFGLVFLPLPVGARTAAARLRQVKGRMDEIKTSPEGAIAYGMLELMGLTLAQVESALLDLFTAKGTAVITNVPGPREPVYLAGAPVSAVAVWAPTSGSVSMSVSIFSYNGQVTVGVMADAGLVPDPGTMIDGFGSELDALARIGRPRAGARGRARSPQRSRR
jgi:WS/DGAT/MGAT family acyltransferase